MFYLIGGAPRSGKTTAAKLLSEQLAVPWISTDTLESIVTDYMPAERVDQLLPKNVMRRETHQSNDEMYTRYSAQEIVDAYIINGRSTYAAIRTYIDCEHTYGHNYILEGHHIHPAMVKQLKSDFPIRSVFLGRKDVGVTADAITRFAPPHDWVTRKTKNIDTYPLIAEMLVLFSHYIEHEALTSGEQFECVDNDFKKVISDVANSFQE